MTVPSRSSVAGKELGTDLKETLMFLLEVLLVVLVAFALSLMFLRTMSYRRVRVRWREFELELDDPSSRTGSGANTSA